MVIETVRVLPDGEAVSVDGTHLGHNLPDGKGNRNLLEVALLAPNITSRVDISLVQN